MQEDSAISDRPRYVLRSSSGNCELVEGETLAGRSRSCQLVLKDPSVSRSHALIRTQGDEVLLRDLSSSNGTFVNGDQVEGERVLRVGDKVTLGETHFSLVSIDSTDEYSFADVLAEAEQADALAEFGEPIQETLQGPQDPVAAPAQPSSPAVREPIPEPVSEPKPESDPGLATRPGSVASPVPEAPPEPPRSPVFEAQRSDLPDISREKTAVGNDTLQEAIRRLAPDLDEALDQALPDSSGETPPPMPSIPSMPLPPKATAPGSSAPSTTPSKEGASIPPALPVAPPSVPSAGSTSKELLPSLDELDELDLAPGLPSAVSPERPAPGPRAKPASELDRPPKSSPQQREVPAAGIGVRALAGLLDGVLVLALGAIASLLAGGPWSSKGATVFYTASFGLQLLLQVFGWHLWGTTPGKRVLGLYVYEAGSRVPGIGAGRALLRFAGYCASALALGFGFLMAAFNRGHRGLHDVLSGTYVGAGRDS
ncbi:MAG: FHA domain-containing protein [Deltaproteobacteria bacterium]|nr:FHA domain-containing protein [Deltaproteobacteria bacterium]